MLSTLVLALVPPCVPSALPPAPDDALKSRELAGIAEEQALLTRQLKRLRQTMEILVLRLEAEGRPRAVELLQEGISLLDQREGDTRALTLEETMEDARERMESGQVVQSLDSQAGVIAGLERLLAILMERGNLDNIEENLERVREMKAALSELAQREKELRQETRELRRDSANDAQRELEAEIARAAAEQRELLAENERSGRESGALALEEIEASLRALRKNLEADSALLEAWRPGDRAELERATDDVEAARRSEARARRLEEESEALREMARAAAGASPAESAELEQALEERQERAERHARASGDEAAERVAEALRQALEAVRAARQGEREAGEAAREAEELAADLEQRAAAERAAANEARERATEELEDLAEEESVGGLTARDVRTALQRATAAAKSGDGARDRERTSRATEEASRALRTGLSDLDRMSEALSGSQSSLADEAERLERGLSALEQGETPDGREAREALDRASESRRAAAERAADESPREAREEARRAERALEAAQQALSRSRESTAAADAEARAERQRELAEQVGELSRQAGEGSMDPRSEAEVGEALREAQRAMERAAEELEENRAASAAGAQREAMEALSRAGEKATKGVRPSSPEDRERAAELSREQAAIREDILRLAMRDEERKNPEALAGMERAREAAEQAEAELGGGELNEAERSEREVERELERAKDELEKEEEQYEALRQEELLFRITEEIQTALEGHRAQMAETAEIDSQRAGDDRPSRAQRLRLRRIAREEEVLAERIGEIAGALEAEGSTVFAEVLRYVESDLGEIAIDLSEEGDHQTGERTRARQQDVEERLEWMLEALREEQRRREREQQDQEQQGQDQQRDSENRLVPNQAELKLLRRLEVEVQEGIERMLVVYPELADEDPADVNPLILDEVMRLAVTHERTSDLFAAFRARLGLPEPGGEPPHGQDGDDPHHPEDEE